MWRTLACRQLVVRAAVASTTTRRPALLRTTKRYPALARPLASKAVKVDKSSSKQEKEKPTKCSSRHSIEGDIRQMQQQIRHLHQYGQYQEALDLSTELLETTTNHFGKDHPVTASAYNNVGLMHKLLGNYKEARSMYHEALRSYGKIVGKDHASYAAALHNLGMLQKSQIVLDEEMSAMERLSLVEETIEYLEEAFQIRRVELGEEHPHTVASQSALGSTIASELLSQQAAQQERQQKEEAEEEQQEFKPSKMTQQRWQAAEQHLREALATATKNPRGTHVAGDDDDSMYSDIRTLSAAAAAQNLAVILKTKSVLCTPMDEDGLSEAKQLYQRALTVRVELLYEAHPDAVTTKFSLAELISVLGNEEEANQMRQEIMDSYNVTEVQDADASKSNDGG